MTDILTVSDRPSESGVPLLQLEGVCREFPLGDQLLRVLDDIHLAIACGEMVAIMGQSGSGKSTLMNILGCLDSSSSGSYRFNGHETRQMSNDELATLRREHFGFIFQRYHLLPHLSAEDNVRIPAIYAGLPEKQQRTLTDNLFRQLGLDKRAHHRPNQLSGGQQQRVSIARALINGGSIILADEPTGALDSRSGEDVLRILKDLNRRGHTVIIVTHDISVARHAERIIEMKDGRIVSDLPNKSVQISSSAASTSSNASIFPNESISSNASQAQQNPGIENAAIRHTGSWNRFKDAFKMATLAMIQHRMRTLLTMLGIIIGIASVVSIVALGEGAQRKVIGDIQMIGTNTVDIYPGKDWGDPDAASIHTLVPADADILASQFYTDSVTPLVLGSKVLRYQNMKAKASIHGVGADYFRTTGIEMSAGIPFSEYNVVRRAQTVVIDENTRKKLFKEWENPIGKIILVGNLPCTIIAITKVKDRLFSSSSDLNLYMPYTTAMGRLLGKSHFDGIKVRLKENVSGEAAVREIDKALTARHLGIKDFFTNTSDGLLKTVQQTTGTLTLLISAIAFISLAVGGIGVMNIMLVSVTERTHEIGIRMAVGARRYDILQQFLIEAILVCLVGGILGILLSFSISHVFEFFVTSIKMEFTAWSLIAACLCSTMVGVTFGYIPARNAARLEPIRALARE